MPNTAALKRLKAENPKRAAFAVEYTKDNNGTRAAMRAGYTQNPASAAVTATALLKDPKVQEVVEIRQQEAAQRVEVTVDYILGGIKRVTENAEATNQPFAALKGFELLGKTRKMFTDRVENVNGLQDATEEELLSRLQALRAQDGKVEG